MNNEITEEQAEIYANWLLNECDAPVSEIIWLVCTSTGETKDEIKHLIKLQS